MANKQADPLFKLIKTLTKPEKRNFRLYVNRVQDSEHIKFVQLFDVLDKQKKYDEQIIFEKLPKIKKTQLSNLKRHLTKQILVSLRLIQKNTDMQVREQIDFAHILYGKGLYLQSLKVLDRVKSIAKESHLDILHLEILEFEKLIESRHITRSIESRADELVLQADLRQQVVSTASQLSNLSLKLYGLYIKLGHIRDEKDFYLVDEFFNSNLPQLDPDNLTFFERVNLYQSYLWYHFIIQNFPFCYKYAQQLVDLFDENEAMKISNPDLYIRCMHNLMINLFYLNNHKKLLSTLHIFEQFIEINKKTFTQNTAVLAFQFINISKLNRHFMEGSCTEAIPLVKEIDKQLKLKEDFLDEHRVLVFYYKIACIYFVSGDNKKAIDYLNRVINLKLGSLREDIQCYSRILHLIAHYELKNYNLLKYLVKSVYRFLGKVEDLNPVQTEILKFLRLAINKNPRDLKTEFIQLKGRLEKSRGRQYESRSFLYLDIISWLQSKIENKSVQQVIQENFKKRRRKIKNGK